MGAAGVVRVGARRRVRGRRGEVCASKYRTSGSRVVSCLGFRITTHLHRMEPPTARAGAAGAVPRRWRWRLGGAGDPGDQQQQRGGNGGGGGGSDSGGVCRQ